jgi:hypothetical protein
MASMAADQAKRRRRCVVGEAEMLWFRTTSSITPSSTRFLVITDNPQGQVQLMATYIYDADHSFALVLWSSHQ